MAPGGTLFRFAPHFGENVLPHGSHEWLPYSKDEVRLKTANNNLQPRVIDELGGMTMDELMDILEALRPDVDFDREEHLVEDGILDSFDIVSIVAELDGVLGVRVGAEELVPENFNSARALWALVRRLRG